MPLLEKPDAPDENLKIRSGTTKSAILVMLYDYEEFAFSPSEVATKLDVKRKTAQKSLSRLADDGLVIRVEGSAGYYHAVDDESVRKNVESLFELEDLEKIREERQPAHANGK